jgi:hypothetical protein
MRYIQKPIAIEAVRLDPRPLIAEDWFWDAVSENLIITHNFGKAYPPAWCEIKTSFGNFVARTGDYIVLGLSGEIYPCKANVFEATHEVPTT